MQVEFEIEDDDLSDIVVNSSVFNDAILDAVSENIDYKEVSENVLDEIRDDLIESIVGSLLDSDDSVNCIADKLAKHRFVVQMSESIEELKTKYTQLLDIITNLELESKNNYWSKFKNWFLKG